MTLMNNKGSNKHLLQAQIFKVKALERQELNFKLKAWHQVPTVWKRTRTGRMFHDVGSGWVSRRLMI